MALISCPECRAETSTLAEACAKCGCPVAKMVVSDVVSTRPILLPAEADLAPADADGGLDRGIPAGLRWVLYLPAGALIGPFVPLLLMALGGWLVGGWKIPSAIVVFIGYGSIPLGMVAVALATAPIASESGAAAVKWIMVGLGALLACSSIVDWYRGDYEVIAHLHDSFGSLSPKGCATVAVCGLVAGVLSSIAVDPLDVM